MGSGFLGNPLYLQPLRFMLQLIQLKSLSCRICPTRYCDAGKTDAQAFCECVPALIKAGFFMRFKALLMDDVAICRAVTRISHEILEHNKGAQDVLLLGILRRGLPLAEMIRDNIQRIEGVSLPCGALDIR